MGFGVDGAVWSAQDAAGQDVVVSVLAAAQDSPVMGRLDALRQGTHPHLARIRQVVRLDDQRCAVISDRVPGPTLATVVAARGRLDAGELAALVSGVGSALGHLHERGVVHGDVAPANVIISAAGRPVLVDLTGQLRHERGTPGFAPPERARGTAAGAAGDVWALGRLLEWAAGGADARVAAVAGPALAARPQDRPSARDIASGAAAIAAEEPIRVPPPAVLAQARMRDASPPTQRRPASRSAARTEAAAGRRDDARGATPGPAAAARRGAARHTPESRRARSRPEASSRTAARRATAPTGTASTRRHARGGHLRRLLPATVAGALVIAAVPVVAGLRDGMADDPGAPDLDAVAELLSRRDAALVEGDPAALAATTVPGSTAERAHTELLDRLTATGTVLDGLRTEPTALVRSVPTRSGAVVDVVLVQHPHQRGVGARREPVPAQAGRCARLDLAHGEAGWRLVDSRPCP
ncbi:MAG TPA: protein kinase [Actinomycetaceae bacterium]|nr:protein kinase [Actinomycetaceae bacterium]